MTSRSQILRVCLLLFVSPVAVSAERLPIKVYTTAEGLPHNTINRIVRDSRGFLWFCTADGLSRFDGYGFTNFGPADGLPHPIVNDLLETRTGEYWVATEGGLARLATSGSRRFTTVAADRQAGALAVTAVNEARDGTIWAATKTGLYRLDRGGSLLLREVDIKLPTDYSDQRFVADVLDDAERNLWIATRSGLYRRRPDGTTVRFTTRDGLPDDFLHDLLEDYAGRIWVASRYGGFFRLASDEDGNGRLVDVAVNAPDPRAPGGWIYQLFISSDRRFWVGTVRGLVQFFPDQHQAEQVRLYASREGLTHFEITALAEDLGGNLWLGTTIAGAMKISRGGFSSFGEQDRLRRVDAIFEDSAGNLCFRGLARGDVRISTFDSAVDPRVGPYGCYDGDRFQWFTPDAFADHGQASPYAAGWVSERVTLRTRNGEWWLGASKGLFRFPPTDQFLALKTAKPKAVYPMRFGSSLTPQVFRLFEDSRRNVWVSTIRERAGLVRWEPATSGFRNFDDAPGLASLRDTWAARAFGEDSQGNVWVGFNGELARYRDGDFELFTAKNGLPPGIIRDIHRDRSGRLWFASSQSGLVRVDQPGSTPAFVSYTTAQGLSSNNAMAITEDLAGHIFVGGGRGVDRLDSATGRVKHFTSVDGLPTGIVWAAYRDRRGELWFGITSGLARLRESRDEPQRPPPVLITAVHLRGASLPLSALGERHITLPALPASENQLQIEFVGLSFLSGDVLRYQYELEGAKGGWGPLTEQRVVTYASLSPGRYRFRVRAVNSDGVESPDSATVMFTILPPLWRRTWFIAFIAVTGILLALALYRYRINRLLEMVRVRSRIATDLHDDIGANLTRIALLSESAKDRDQQAGPLEAIARIARESVGSMSDIVWSINPKRESLNDLIRRMRQHADEVFTQRGVEVRFAAPGAAEDVKLGMEVRRDLLLVFKEIVNNAVRHSRCSAVAIDLALHRSRLVLRIADNGVGFDTSADHEGQGMTSLRRRTAALKGRIDVVSGGTGTTVTLDVPL